MFRDNLEVTKAQAMNWKLLKQQCHCLKHGQFNMVTHLEGANQEVPALKMAPLTHLILAAVHIDEPNAFCRNAFGQTRQKLSYLATIVCLAESRSIHQFNY